MIIGTLRTRAYFTNLQIYKSYKFYNLLHRDSMPRKIKRARCEEVAKTPWSLFNLIPHLLLLISDAVAVRREELRAVAGCVARKIRFADAFEFLGASVSARFLTACGHVAIVDDDPRSCVDENQMSSVVGVFVLLWDSNFCLGSSRNFCNKFTA